jgi:hypothetical protein
MKSWRGASMQRIAHFSGRLLQNRKTSTKILPAARVELRGTVGRPQASRKPAQMATIYFSASP